MMDDLPNDPLIRVNHIPDEDLDDEEDDRVSQILKRQRQMRGRANRGTGMFGTM